MSLSGYQLRVKGRASCAKVSQLPEVENFS